VIKAFQKFSTAFLPPSLQHAADSQYRHYWKIGECDHMELAFIAVPLWIFLGTNLLFILVTIALLARVQRQVRKNTDHIINIDLWVTSVDQMFKQQQKAERKKRIMHIVDQQAMEASRIRH
jgi:hypothetical protein